MKKLLLCFALIRVSTLVTGAELLLKITGPEKAKVGSPVVIRVEGIPTESSVNIVKKGFLPDDIWLEFYDKDGTPVNIFWSKVTGTRYLIVFVAVNGTEKPDTAVVEYTLKYQDILPDPIPNPIPEPTPDLKVKVGSLLSYVAANNITESDITKVATFYMDFSEAIPENISSMTTLDFRKVYIEAGKKVLGGDLKGKYAGFGAIIDKIIMAELGDTEKKLPLSTATLLQAIAWAIYEGNK